MKDSANPTVRDRCLIGFGVSDPITKRNHKEELMAKRNLSPDFLRALEIGRPPNVAALFPNSKALIVSGKYIDRAMLKKGKAIAMAANGRSHFVIRGALRAAQRANSCLIIEIARSEGGAGAYCAVNFWNMARQVDTICNHPCRPLRHQEKGGYRTR